MKIFVTLIFTFCFLCSFSQKALHLYGGKGHDVYLGCLNCDGYADASIWNQYGTYGSSYNAKSIWNSYGDYGSVYGDYSPFNSYASYPPVVVDKDGGFYGYFTVNLYKDKRFTSTLALTIYKYFDLIRKDVSAWYKKLFQG